MSWSGGNAIASPRHRRRRRSPARPCACRSIHTTPRHVPHVPLDALLGLESEQLAEKRRRPLKDVVRDCERRWFADTLDAAREGCIESMQSVAEMYAGGWGIPPSTAQAAFWRMQAQEARRALLLDVHDSSPSMDPVPARTPGHQT